uniref:Chemokine interleukin-8-like domain-containing protein n=1 Tax=Neolamprologus brichardi TaxID=32507 RepID=A0A3Q4HZI9_NEOBR
MLSVLLVFKRLVLKTTILIGNANCCLHLTCASCCEKTSNIQIHQDRLKSYYIQQPPSCSVTTVVFTTACGRRICSDTMRLWTQMSMAYLDGKSLKKESMFISA